MQDLEGRVAVVTGAASGIGLARSRRLGADGMQVMMADVDERALAAAESLAGEGSRAATAVTDVSDAGSVDDLARADPARFGAVHVVCNDAGGSRGGPTWDIPLPIWEWIVGFNLSGPPGTARGPWWRTHSATRGGGLRARRSRRGWTRRSSRTAARDAIVADRFWIFTNPGYGGAIADRYAGAVRGRNGSCQRAEPGR
jgi:NAD(P)-dependent dehydrogenase (short-subunit alcohol dehydrogenase family)